MPSVSIDFVAGSHGNFLEYVCNRFISKSVCTDSVFTELGTSHNKNNAYYDQAVFKAGHFSEFNLPTHNNVIRILFNSNDLLTLSSVSLFRAGDTGIDNNQLNINTFCKLNNTYYQDLVDEINFAYPDYAITPQHPDCPRFVLREFFKFGFRNPSDHGFLKQLQAIVNNRRTNLFDFQFNSFYNKKLFITSVHAVAKWYGSLLSNEAELEELYDKFILQNPYVHHKTHCDEIINSIICSHGVSMPELTLFQESYINGKLEQLYPGLEMPFVQYEYFTNTKDIIEYIKCSK